MHRVVDGEDIAEIAQRETITYELLHGSICLRTVYDNHTASLTNSKHSNILGITASLQFQYERQQSNELS